MPMEIKNGAYLLKRDEWRFYDEFGDIPPEVWEATAEDLAAFGIAYFYMRDGKLCRVPPEDMRETDNDPG